MGKVVWTAQMIATLRERYPDEGYAIAKDLGVSESAVKAKARKLNVRVKHPHARVGRAPWLRRYPNLLEQSNETSRRHE